jgi:hypothetical protein
MHVKLLPAFGGPGLENENHFQDALRAKDLHVSITCGWAKVSQENLTSVSFSHILAV